MGEKDPVIDGDFAVCSQSPRCTGKVSEAVDGHHGSLRERRDMKRGHEMGAMMFDWVHRALKTRTWKRRVQEVRYTPTLLSVSEASQRQAHRRRMSEHVSGF